MKKIYETGGCRAYNLTIEGYPCTLVEFKSGWVSVGVPIGDNEADRAMFDKLVYHNQKLYNGTDSKTVIKNVREFIKNYKK